MQGRTRVFGPANGQRGQGMTEYIVVVALVAVAAIGVYNFFGQTIRAQTAGIALEMSGQAADPALRAAKRAADTASNQAQTQRGLDSYGAGNR